MVTRLKILTISAISFLMLFQFHTAKGQEYGVQRTSPWIPDDAIVQYAGSIGFLSTGAGYSFAQDRIETDILVGYVPRSVGGVTLWTAALKANWVPFQLNTGKRFNVIPLTTGLMVSHTFGPNYFVLQPDRYPTNYYTFSTALHLYYQLGSRFQFQLWEESFPEMSLYYELNSSAEAIFSYIQNPKALSPADIFFLSLGFRISLD